MTKTEKVVQLRVRLSPAAEGKAAQVAFTPTERKIAHQAAIEMGYPARWGLSSFVRDCGVAAAAGYEQKLGQNASIADMLEAAATDAGMKVGAWLRCVVLETLEMSTARRKVLEAQCEKAREAYVTNNLRLSGDDVEEGE